MPQIDTSPPTDFIRTIIETRDIGTSWAQSMASPVLAVPSAVVQIETNFLLNPLHPEFTKITIGGAQAFSYDPRLVKR